MQHFSFFSGFYYSLACFDAMHKHNMRVEDRANEGSFTVGVVGGLSLDV